MRDAFSYMTGDPEDRWEDAEEFLIEDDENLPLEEEVYGIAGGSGHPLANGRQCYCALCVPYVDPHARDYLCCSKGPAVGLVCDRLKDHDGRCSTFTGSGDYLVEWDKPQE
jgi:hypothetical protein